MTQLPSFTGLRVHREPEHRCSFLYPEGWQTRELQSALGGTVLLPDPDDPHTSFSFEGRDLGTDVRPGDLSALRSGFVAGLRQLPGCRIERREAEALGGLITMEARLTFRDGDQTRKRWVRLAYQGRTQARLVAQGSSPERFDYWEPMFFQAMRTFRFGDWWAEATGVAWADTVFNEDAREPDSAQ
jgi:hypothetical protein